MHTSKFFTLTFGVDVLKLSQCNFGVCLEKNGQTEYNARTISIRFIIFLYLLPILQTNRGLILLKPDECVFCGGRTIEKLPYSDRIKKVSAGGGVLETSSDGSVEIDPHPQKEPHYKCNGCNRKYVDAELDISIIINNLQCEPIISVQIYHYYQNGVTLTDLMTKYRTGIVRKPSHFFSPLSEKVAKRQLFICFNYNGRRTVGTFVKEKENDIEYYKMKMLGIP